MHTPHLVETLFYGRVAQQVDPCLGSNSFGVRESELAHVGGGSLVDARIHSQSILSSWALVDVTQG
jgi:hypothetical protein